MKRTLAVGALLFVLSVMALAHGKEKHVMGTVTSISDSSITVESTAKKSVTVDVNDKTKFEKSGSPATLIPSRSCRCFGRQARRKRSPLWRHERQAVHGGDEGNGGHGS